MPPYPDIMTESGQGYFFLDDVPSSYYVYVYAGVIQW